MESRSGALYGALGNELAAAANLTPKMGDEFEKALGRLLLWREAFPRIAVGLVRSGAARGVEQHSDRRHADPPSFASTYRCIPGAAASRPSCA